MTGTENEGNGNNEAKKEETTTPETTNETTSSETSANAAPSTETSGQPEGNSEPATTSAPAGNADVGNTAAASAPATAEPASNVVEFKALGSISGTAKVEKGTTLRMALKSMGETSPDSFSYRVGDDNGKAMNLSDKINDNMTVTAVKKVSRG